MRLKLSVRTQPESYLFAFQAKAVLVIYEFCFEIDRKEIASFQNLNSDRSSVSDRLQLHF
jgi:hypothetical protein